jgi:cell division protein FtsI/penicillin-binding protein 2
MDKQTGMRVYFTFENGRMQDFKNQLHRLWNKYYVYDGSPMNNVTLTISTKTNQSLNQLLIQKKPPRSMLVTQNPTASK